MNAELSIASAISYPESDGTPVGETDAHRQEILDLIAALSEYYRLDPLVYVSGNLMFFYEEGNPSAVVSPDVFVVKGVAKDQRRVYKLWVEGRPPAVVIEISSRSTRLQDLGTKRALYAMLGVEEYFLFDPLAEYLNPQLQGFRLSGGDYARLEADADGELVSAVLGLRLRTEGSHLALFEMASGTRLLRPAEEAEARRGEAEARRAAEQRAGELEAELERLRAELERLRRDQ